MQSADPREGAGLEKRVQAEDTVPREFCAHLRERGEGRQWDAEGTESERGHTGSSAARRAGCRVAEAEVEGEGWGVLQLDKWICCILTNFTGEYFK